MKLKTTIMVTAGAVLLVMGAIGMLLPIWPTTPFVLCSVGCFAGSPRLRSAVLKIGFFREYYENYQTRQGLSKRTVAGSMIFLWGMLLLSCLLTQRLWVTALLLCVGVAVTAHLLYMARGKEPKS